MKRLIYGLVVVILAVGCNQGQSGNPLPASIADMDRTNVIQGEDADKIITELHRKVVTDQQNFIGKYSDDQYSATLYITRYDNENGALEDFRRMAERINKPEIGGSMGFQHVRPVPELGNHAYMTLQGGRVHYYFVKDEMLYWLDVHPEIAMQVVEDFGTEEAGG
jgi:hypothetical protein